MSVLDTINQNNIEHLKKEEAEKIETFDTASKIDVVFDLFMHAFFNNIIKEGNLKRLKGYIFVGLNNSKITKYGLKYLSNCKSSIKVPFLTLSENNSHIIEGCDGTKIVKSDVSIWFPINCVMFSFDNEYKHAICPRIEFDGLRCDVIHSVSSRYCTNHISHGLYYDGSTIKIRPINGYIRLNEHGIPFFGGYENNQYQISYIKSKFETALRAEGINLNKIEILKTSKILYHEIEHLFKSNEIKSNSPKDSKCIYFEISW